MGIEQDQAGEKHVLEKNHGKRIIPTVEFADGSLLVEPTNAELAAKLGLQTEPKYPYYDLMIVGGGPAGLTAALYAAREGNRVVVIERAGLGGQAAFAVSLDNFPGFPEGINGLEFCDRLVAQARRFGVEILQAQDVAIVWVSGSRRGSRPARQAYSPPATFGTVASNRWHRPWGRGPAPPSRFGITSRRCDPALTWQSGVNCRGHEPIVPAGRQAAARPARPPGGPRARY